MFQTNFHQIFQDCFDESGQSDQSGRVGWESYRTWATWNIECITTIVSFAYIIEAASKIFQTFKINLNCADTYIYLDI